MRTDYNHNKRVNKINFWGMWINIQGSITFFKPWIHQGYRRVHEVPGLKVQEITQLE